MLSGCRIGEPNELELVTDARILRGRYTGAVDTRYASNTVALSADNTVLAMGEGDGRAVVQLWDTATQTPLKSLGTLDDRNFFGDDVALSADGSVVASLFSNCVQLWDSQTGTRRLTLNTEKFIGACSYCAIRFDLSSDGRYVAVGKRRVALFDARTGAHLRRFDLPSDWLEALTFSADGTLLAALSTDPLESGPPHTFHMRVWNPLENETVFSYSGKTATPHLALSSDGRKLAFVDGQQVQVIDIDTMQTDTMRAVATFPLPKAFSSLALDRSGNRLALTTFAYSETSRPATLIFDTALGGRWLSLMESA